MVFNKLFGAKSKPFLELSKGPSQAVVVAPVRASETVEEPTVQTKIAEIKIAAVAPAALAVPTPAAPGAASAPTERQLTTAELLAAEQAAVQAEVKPSGPVTFAAELLQPSAALPRRRRRPGAALADFKAIAKGLGRG